MIRGAIDYCDGIRLGGWLHSDDVGVRDRTVLAFVDERCVGGGKIERFREDLAQAGIGDGYVGFDFPVSLPDDESLSRTVVRLEGSDLALLQPTSRVVELNAAHKSKPAKAEYSLDTINWMLERDWLGQTEFEFLKSVVALGIYDRSLRLGRNQLADADGEAQRLFELYHQRGVSLQTRELSLEKLSDTASDLVSAAEFGLIAVHAPGGAINVLEGSQHAPRFERQSDVSGAVRYMCRPDRLLFLDSRASFFGEGQDTATIFFAV